MIFAVDFDGTIVDQSGEYDDLTTPLKFMPGAKEALLALKASGHILILFSARTNPWLVRDPALDPLVLAGVKVAKERDLSVNQARYRQMFEFVKTELPEVFSLVWEHRGKPTADVFIDDRAIGYSTSYSWERIARTYAD